MDGKTNGNLDLDVLKAKMKDYAQMDCSVSPYTDDTGKAVGRHDVHLFPLDFHRSLKTAGLMNAGHTEENVHRGTFGTSPVSAYMEYFR